MRPAITHFCLPVNLTLGACEFETTMESVLPPPTLLLEVQIPLERIGFGGGVPVAVRRRDSTVAVVSERTTSGLTA
jgi:hypothetical protein